MICKELSCYFPQKRAIFRNAEKTGFQVPNNQDKRALFILKNRNYSTKDPLTVKWRETIIRIRKNSLDKGRRIFTLFKLHFVNAYNDSFPADHGGG